MKNVEYKQLIESRKTGLVLGVCGNGYKDVSPLSKRVLKFDSPNVANFFINRNGLDKEKYFVSEHGYHV